MPRDHNVAGAIADLKSAFDQANTYLSPKLETVHTHRMISFRENRSSTNLLGEWIKSGAVGRPPSLNALQLRSQIYGFGRSASDAKAYRIVFLNVCREFFSAALLALPLGKPLTFARSIVERFAVACDIIAKVQPIIRRPANNPSDVFNNLVVRPLSRLKTSRIEIDPRCVLNRSTTSRDHSDLLGSYGSSGRDNRFDLRLPR